VIVEWLGTVPYRDALSRQREYRERVIRGEAPEALWLLEHPPVITTGRRGAGVDAERVARAGFDLVETERGGLATCHEPGQLVGYVFRRCESGVRSLVCGLEGGIIAACGALGVRAWCRDGYPGAWASGGKLCAIGLHVRRGVSMHGFALNLVNDLGGFDLIVPCGLRGAGVSSVAREAGTAPSPRDAAPLVGDFVAGALRKNVPPRVTTVDERGYWE